MSEHRFVSQDEKDYAAEVAKWSRAEKLCLLRAGGFTAHKIKDGAELTMALVLLRRRNLRVKGVTS